MVNHDHRHARANYDKAFAIGIALNVSYVVAEAVFGAARTLTGVSS
jgi:cobalt-zinc-cadmium efflux system protein